MTRASPQFLAEFKLASALDIDSCYNQILSILKVYIPAQDESPDLVAEHLACNDQAKAQLILDYCKQTQKQSDLTNTAVLGHAKQRSQIGSEGKRSVAHSSFSSLIKQQRPTKQPTGNTLATAKSSVGATTKSLQPIKISSTISSQQSIQHMLLKHHTPQTPISNHDDGESLCSGVSADSAEGDIVSASSSSLKNALLPFQNHSSSGQPACFVLEEKAEVYDATQELLNIIAAKNTAFTFSHSNDETIQGFFKPDSEPALNFAVERLNETQAVFHYEEKKFLSFTLGVSYKCATGATTLQVELAQHCPHPTEEWEEVCSQIAAAVAEALGVANF